MTTLDKGPLAKTYQLDANGEICSVPYANISEFMWYVKIVESIQDFYKLLLECLSKSNVAIIRGLPTPQTRKSSERNNGTFPEHPEGTRWCMLDIDGVPAPEGVAVCSEEAIKHVISLLPAEFRAASCVYMFSNSAGIHNQNGTLFKEGIRVHLFYYLNRPVLGKMMASYLENYCHETRFYTVGLNKGNLPMVSLGIDMAPIKSSVQLHYTAPPIIGAGIQVDIGIDQRLGFIQGNVDSVAVPDISDALPEQVAHRRSQIREEYALANGFKPTTKRVQVGNCSHTYVALQHEGDEVRTARTLTDSRLRSGGHVLQLFLNDERSTGSWRVQKSRPYIAIRYGDEMEIPLEELCPEAIEKVRELGWITELPEEISAEELARALAEPEDQIDVRGEAAVGTLEHRQNTLLRNENLPYYFDNGFIYISVAKKDDVIHLKISSYIYVYGHLRDTQSQNWSYILHLRNREGGFSEVVLPFSALFGQPDFRQTLATDGAIINPAIKPHYLINYIQEYPVQNCFLLVDKLGWTQDQSAFLLPSQIITKTGEEQKEKPYLNPAIQNNVKAIKESETLEEWQSMVAEPCAGNSLLEMMLYVSFLPPLLELLNLPNIGIHLYGETSRGKTTALQVAASVYGDPSGMVHMWRTTDNAMESLAYSHNSAVLLLDEINQASLKTLGETIYMLGNGAGKNRAKQDSSLRAAKRWRLAFISTGEVRTDDYLRQDSTHRVKGGQAVRMLDISIDAGQEMGVVEALGRFSNPGEFVGHLHSATHRFYGTAVVAYIQRLLDGTELETLTQSHEETQRGFLSQVDSAGQSTQVSRILNRFASIAFAGELAIRLGILPFQEGQALTSMVKVARRYLDNREGVEGSDILEAIHRMRRTWSEYRFSRFLNCTTNQSGRTIFLDKYVIPQTFWGFYQIEDDQTGYYYIPAHTFKDTFCQEISHREVLKALHARGWMESTVAKNFGPERVRCYKISDRFVDEYPEATDEEKAEAEAIRLERRKKELDLD